MNNKSKFFEQFFASLNESKIPYVIMNGYEDYPEVIGSDIDICTESHTLFERFLKKTSSELEYEYIQKLEHHPGGINYFIAKNFDGKWEVLSLDVYEHYLNKGATLFSNSWFLKEKEAYKSFYISSKESEFIYYFVKKVIKQDLVLALHNIFKAYNKVKNTVTFPVFFKKSNQQILRALSIGDKDYFEKNSLRLKDELREYSSPEIKNVFKEFIRVVKRVFLPTGVSISFLGPDGSGKSTIIDALQKEGLPFRRVDYFHLKPISVLSPEGDGKPVLNPHAKKNYPGLLSYIKLFHFMSGYWLGHLGVLKLKIKSSLIIFDRYYDDFYIDPRRFRYGGSLYLARLMRRFIPRPDITFVLVASPNVIYARKQEVEFSELERQIELYKSLESNHYILIDVDRNVDDIVNEIVSNIYGKLNERY